MSVADSGGSTTDTQINLEQIRQRWSELSEQIVHTPAVEIHSPLIGELLGGGSAWLKLECLQHTGTFKARGALSVANRIPESRRAFGITAASAGNHAIAAAWAAKHIGASAKVVMQSNANPFRVAMAKAEGAEVVSKEPGHATFSEAERLVQDEGRTYIHPFEGPHTTLGAAGVGLEFMQQVPDLEAVIVGVGGGGLISGVAAAVKLINPECKVYGVEPIGADSMSRSFVSGKPETLEKVDSIADSLGAPMALPFSFGVCRRYVDEMVTLNDDLICAGMVIAQEEAKLAVEPAAGAAIAGALGPLRERLQGKKIGIVICGANIDAATYLKHMERGRDNLSALGEV